MKKKKTINQVIPNWLIGDGIFSYLNGFDVPWQLEDVSGFLDLEYEGNISGDKYISPLVSKLMSGDILTSDEMEKLAGVIYTMFNDNWRREWNTLYLSYNPIENYNSVEIMSNDITEIEKGTTHTRTEDLTHKKTGTDTNTPNLTETRTPNLTNNGTETVSGFNSVNMVNSSGSTNSQTGTETNRTTGSNATAYNTTDKDTGTVTDKDTGTDTHTRNYELTRKGNIGVTTSQQMIQSERDLYMWNFFYQVVFPDIDRVLTLPIY